MIRTGTTAHIISMCSGATSTTTCTTVKCDIDDWSEYFIHFNNAPTDTSCGLMINLTGNCATTAVHFTTTTPET